MHPGDPQATTYLLNAVVFQELYRLDLLDTTFYANDGFLTGKHVTQEDPKVRDRIFALADEAVHEADWRISKNPNDIDALYARGWARSLKCAYMAMVERGFGAGFRLAMKAKDDHMRVLQLDPDYADAKLVTGVYEYVVGALPLPFKFIIGFAGISGSKSKGLQMLNDAASRGVITSVEARTVIALFLRREARYKEAIQVVRSLKSQYPRDYLFCLEEANLRKDAGEGHDRGQTPIARCWRTRPSQGILRRRGWNWPTSAWETHCAASASFAMPRARTSRLPTPPMSVRSSRSARCSPRENAMT